MHTITKELEQAISIHARQGFEHSLCALASDTYDSAIEHGNSMHVGSVEDENIAIGCENTTRLLKLGRELGIDKDDWIKWHVVISPVHQQPVIFIEVLFSRLFAYSELCKDYAYDDIDEADEVIFEPAEGKITHNYSENPLGNIVGTYIRCVFDYQNIELPLLIHFDMNERISAQSVWEYQVTGMGEKIDVMAIALHLRMIKHAGDRMNMIRGSELLGEIQSYYTALFHIYEQASQDASRYERKSRGVYIGDPETEALLRNRLRKMEKHNSKYKEENIVDFPEPDNGFNQCFDWMDEE